MPMPVEETRYQRIGEIYGPQDHNIWRSTQVSDRETREGIAQVPPSPRAKPAHAHNR
jgi:hypothetical protein